MSMFNLGLIVGAICGLFVAFIIAISSRQGHQELIDYYEEVLKDTRTVWERTCMEITEWPGR